MGLCAGGDISVRVPDLTCKHVTAPGASQKVQKWVQQNIEQLGFGVCRKYKQRGKGDAHRDGTGTCTVYNERLKPYEVLTSHKSQGKD